MDRSQKPSSANSIPSGSSPPSPGAAMEEIRSFPRNPWEVLGVTREAGDREIREAYENRRREGDSSPGILSTAYRLIRTEQDRRRWELLQPLPYQNPEDLLQEIRPRPLYSGPEAWLKALRP